MIENCPFCGSDDVMITTSEDRYGIRTWANGDITYEVSCNRCMAKSGVAYERLSAVSAWNRRIGKISVQKISHKIKIYKEE
jgi:Lar family restriction alleviation protein